MVCSHSDQLVANLCSWRISSNTDNGRFGPFVCTADSGVIWPLSAACCCWLGRLLRRMSQIEETQECGAETLPLIIHWLSWREKNVGELRDL